MPLLVILSEAGAHATAESKDPYIDRTAGPAARAFFLPNSPVILSERDRARSAAMGEGARVAGPYFFFSARFFLFSTRFSNSSTRAWYPPERSSRKTTSGERRSRSRSPI